MKSIGFILALLLFGGILFGIGYGFSESWGFLSHQWSLLDDNLKPVIFLISTVIIICSLLVILTVKSSFRRTLNSSAGKTAAYSDFMDWYVDVDKNDFSDLQLTTIQNLRKGFLLWAGNNVVKQFNKFYQEISKENPEPKTLEQYANFIYIEILRDLGHRAGSKLRQI